MSREDYPYPEDEFDDLGHDRAPQGVHRAPLPRWRRLLPFLIVLVLAPTLAFVAVRALTGGGPGSPEPTPTVTATGEPTSAEQTTEETSGEDATAEPGEDTTTEESTTEEPTTGDAADLDRSVQIWVLNGSGVSGLAADTVAVLTDDGWLDANAADYGRAKPTATTLFYDNDGQAAQAQAIGELLGISNRVEDADAADGDIVIVLRSDFSLP